MTDTITLVAGQRERVGKGGAREVRRGGRIPAVIYGGEGEPLSITLDAKQITLQSSSTGFFSQIYEVDLEGNRHRVLARELQEDPVSGKPLHLDLIRITDRSTVVLDIDVALINEDAFVGAKKGGLVNVALRSLQVVCRADSIPDVLEIDLTGLDVGDAVRAADVPLPPGVKLGSVEPDATVINIAAPKGGGVTSDEDEDGGEDEAAESEET